MKNIFTMEIAPWVALLLSLVVIVIKPLRKRLIQRWSRIDAWLRKSYANHQIIWSILVAFIPIAIVIYVAIEGASDLRLAWSNAISLSGPGSAQSWPKYILMLAISIAFIVLFFTTQYVRVRGELDKNHSDKQTREDLIKATSVLPSLKFMFHLKSEPFDVITKAVTDAKESELFRRQAHDFQLFQEADEALDQVSEAIRVVLATLAGLAEQYSIPQRLTVKKEQYGASLMLFFSNTSFDLLPKVCTTRAEENGVLRFVQPDFAKEKLMGVLVLNDDLRYIGLEKEDEIRKKAKGASPKPEISLPARLLDQEEFLLGAPRAIRSDEPSKVLETRGMGSRLKHNTGKIIAESIDNYFKTGGPGENIRSLLSVRIGTSDAPLGVMTFDSNIPNFLGNRDEHYDVFLAFLKPSLVLLRPLVHRYATLWWRMLEIESESQFTNDEER